MAVFLSNRSIGQKSKVIRPAKIFCEAHNFVPYRDFDKLIFAFKFWDAADADCGIARVNRATRARAQCMHADLQNVKVKPKFRNN
jgi:hypothetical protein